MAKLEIRCPGCSKRYQVDAAKIGKSARCKKCDTSFEITASGSSADTPDGGRVTPSSRSAQGPRSQLPSLPSSGAEETQNPAIESKEPSPTKRKQKVRASVTAIWQAAGKLADYSRTRGIAWWRRAAPVIRRAPQWAVARAKAIVAFYWAHREDLWRQLLGYSLRRKSAAWQRREICLSVQGQYRHAQWDGSRWEVQLPDCCVVCSEPAEHLDQHEHQMAADLFWPFWAPLIGLGVGVLLSLFFRTGWFLLISTLTGVVLGYRGRRKRDLEISYRRCAKHLKSTTYPRLRYDGSRLFIGVGHPAVKGRFLAIDVDASKVKPASPFVQSSQAAGVSPDPLEKSSQPASIPLSDDIYAFASPDDSDDALRASSQPPDAYDDDLPTLVESPSPDVAPPRPRPPAPVADPAAGVAPSEDADLATFVDMYALQTDDTDGVQLACTGKHELASKPLQGAVSGVPKRAPETDVFPGEAKMEPEPSEMESGGILPGPWNVGDVVLDLYEVKGLLGEGGMGWVYRVWHQGWKQDLALKVPSDRGLAMAGGKQKFVEEAETWVKLLLHPNIVQAFYVRKLDDDSTGIFAECCEGGSLKDWIAQGKTKDLKTVLDIAIQIGWGMTHSHAQGLVHRDLKPANVLMTPDGTAKVTDFGLAWRGVGPGDDNSGQPSAAIQVTTAAGTPGYMAPEQASSGAQIDLRADIFAFGATLWRLLGGRTTWARKSPAIAKRSVEAMLKEREPAPLPARLTDLILRCLEPEPEDRWSSFAAVIDELRIAWSELVGDDYQRPEPKAGDLLANGLNNRGISLLDLGQTDNVEKAFDQALEADPHHIEATYNRGLVQWRSGRITDQELVRQLEEVRSTQTDSWLDDYYLGVVHLERGDAESAKQVLQEAADQSGNDRLVAATLESAQESGGAERAFAGHTHSVTAVAFSPDGCWALSGSEDKTLRYWDLSAGLCLWRFTGHTSSVTSVAFSPDGCRALSSSGDGTLRLWELSTGRSLRTFKRMGEVISVAISPDGGCGLSGSSDNTLCIRDLSTGRHVKTFKGALARR